MYFKDFDTWNTLKKKLNDEVRNTNIRAGEVRWISCGVNVGSEIDGKGVSFTRPALVLHVIGSALALVVPLSTKVKDIAGYIPFEFQERTISLCVHQVRTVSQQRVLARKGRISDKRLEEAKAAVKKFFSF
jgi:mRNA interferase MazF